MPSNLNPKMDNVGIDPYYLDSGGYYAYSTTQAGPSTFEDGSFPFSAAAYTDPASSNWKNDRSMQLPSDEDIARVLCSATVSQMDMLRTVFNLMDRDDPNYSLAVMRQIREHMNRSQWHSPQEFGPSAHLAAPSAAEDEASPAIVPELDPQTDATLEHTPQAVLVNDTPESLVDSAPVPYFDVNAQASLPTPSTERSEPLLAPTSDVDVPTPASKPTDDAASPLPGPASEEDGPEDGFSLAMKLGYIGNQTWLKMDEAEVVKLAKEYPFMALHPYITNPRRPVSQTPFFGFSTEYSKATPKECGLKTGGGARGDNTKKYKEVWEAGAKAEHLRKKQEARATPAVESEAEGSTSSGATTSKKKATGEKSYAPMTKTKREALFLALDKGEEMLKGIQDPQLKAFLKTTLDNADKKLKQSIKNSEKRAQNKAKKNAKEQPGIANAEEVQLTGAPGLQEKGVTGNSSECTSTMATTAAVTNSKKRKEVAAVGAQAAHPSQKKQKGVPRQKEHSQTSAAQTVGLGSSTTDSLNFPSTDYTSIASYAHMRPYGNIPSAAVRSMQDASGPTQTYVGYGIHSANATMSYASMNQQLAEGDSISLHSYPSQPVAGPSRLSQQTVAYPSPTTDFPQNGAHFPFSFVATRPTYTSHPFTQQSTSSASPNFGYPPASSNIAMPSPVGTSLDNYYLLNSGASSQRSNAPLTYHQTENTAAQFTGFPPQQSTFFQNTQLPTPPTPLNSVENPFDLSNPSILGV